MPMSITYRNWRSIGLSVDAWHQYVAHRTEQKIKVVAVPAAFGSGWDVQYAVHPLKSWQASAVVVLLANVDKERATDTATCVNGKAELVKKLYDWDKDYKLLGELTC